MIAEEGNEIVVNIYDISTDGGYGFELPIRASRAKTVKIGEEVRFKVISSNGQRIGVKKVV